MKLALGTVQFGLRYGVANANGQVASSEVVAILRTARDAGIDTLDTAISYGTSEQRLGELGVRDWKIVTKLPPLPPGLDDVRVWVGEQLASALRRLDVSRLDGLLMHKPSDLLGSHGVQYARALQDVRHQGQVLAVGYSIYSPDELDALCDVFPPDLVQAPFNVLDRRLANSGWMSRLAGRGVRIHTRSVFLQGLLLMPSASRPAWFGRWFALLDGWQRACREFRRSPLEMALGFALAHPEIERVVVGVDSATQLEEVIKAALAPPLSVNDFPAIESSDLELIDPFKWKLQ